MFYYLNDYGTNCFYNVKLQNYHQSTFYWPFLVTTGPWLLLFVVISSFMQLMFGNMETCNPVLTHRVFIGKTTVCKKSK